ncbi:hypothetical protein Tco_1242842 [Tanacetum coccineum]
MTFDDNTSGLVAQRQMTLNHQSSNLAPQRQTASDYDNSGPVLRLQQTSVHNSTKLGILDYNNKPSSLKLVLNVSSDLSDNLQQKDTQPTLNVQPTLELIIPPINVNAKENNTDEAEDEEFEAYEFINPLLHRE